MCLQKVSTAQTPSAWTAQEGSPGEQAPMYRLRGQEQSRRWLPSVPQPDADTAAFQLPLCMALFP